MVQFLQHNENNVKTDITKKAKKENGCVQIDIANALVLYIEQVEVGNSIFFKKFSKIMFKKYSHQKLVLKFVL